ncbi:MAG TPA: hypothetical protein VM532_02470 [Burkholderiales bacterium]|nr:hypothetical protein [Burkholderiales bacterium]
MSAATAQGKMRRRFFSIFISLKIPVEIIAEIILQIFVWILQFLGELLIQLVGEAIAELIGHSVTEPFRRPKPVHPWLAAIGYLIFGAIAGALSLWLLPNLFVKAEWLRYGNLILTPMVAGIFMAVVGSWRRKREKEVIRLDSFSYGFCFAFSMALVRFIWGH